MKTTNKKILVTSALPYVNNVPHLGTMVCIISADVFTRYLRVAGKDVVSVLGTDEHGTTTEWIAMQMEMTPQQAVDYFYKIHKEVYDWFNCEFDCFGRTHSKENEEITHDIFLKLHENGFISEKEEEQMFDEKAGKFLSDRFIEGECPFCGFQDARGDQCDKCGKLLEPAELKNPRSKLTGTKPVMRKTKHLYIKLDKLQPKIEKFAKERKKLWSENAYTTTMAWLSEGLKPRAITRDLDWGIHVPLKGYEKKVFYVWFDAPIGYISITKKHRKDWHELWHSPKGVELVQFMGKDNIPFHTVLFPASLIGADDNYTLMKRISVNEYLNYEDDKFSKSRGIGVFGDSARETGIPADVWRYYLIINRPENADTKFTWKDLQEKMNSDLVGNIGNLVNRTLTFVARFSAGKIGKILDPLDYEDDVEEILKSYDDIELKKALKQVMALSKRGNQYFQEQAPWQTVKTDPEKAKNALAVLVNLIKDISVLVFPVMPKVAGEIQAQLGMKPDFSLKALKHKLENHKIGTPKPIFAKLEDDRLNGLYKQFSGKQGETTESDDALGKADLRVAKITSIERHPDAEKLYIEKLDVGNGETRTIVSGLVPYYEPKQLLGKHIIIVYNLKPAKLRGILSQGMLLAAGDGKDVGILHCPDLSPGARITFPGIKGKTATELSVDGFFQIQIESDGKAVKFSGKAAEQEIKVDKSIKGKVK